MGPNYLIFYACPRLRFPDGMLTIARGVLFLLSAEYSSNVRGLSGNLGDLTVFQYELLSYSETLVSDMSHVSELLVSEFGYRFVVPGHDASYQKDGCTRVRWIWSILPTQI